MAASDKKIISRVCFCPLGSRAPPSKTSADFALSDTSRLRPLAEGRVLFACKFGLVRANGFKKFILTFLRFKNSETLIRPCFGLGDPKAPQAHKRKLYLLRRGLHHVVRPEDIFVNKPESADVFDG